MRKDIAPCSRGFDKNFTLLPGAGNHHAWEPQLDEGELLFPGLMSTEGLWMENEEFVDRSALPKDFYSTTSFTDRLIEFLRTRPAVETEKPFFAYLPLTAPHWPLQAPKEYVQKYGTSSPDYSNIVELKIFCQLECMIMDLLL